MNQDKDNDKINTSETFEALCRERFACRGYDPARAVSDEQVRTVLEAARQAPSACNRQPLRFVIVRDEASRHALLAKSRPAFKDAPVVIAACSIPSEAWVREADGKNHSDIDAAIAVEHICLAATCAGLATCWVCSFDTEAARRVLRLPDGVEPVALVPLGYAAEGVSAPEKIRKSLDEICSCEHF